jgi:hypothetical protein
MDSARYYRWELVRIRRASDSAMRHSEEWLTAQQGLERAEGKRGVGGDYAGFVLFGGVMNARLDAFRQTLTDAGFTPMNDNAFKFGVGISTRSNNTIVDFYFLSGTAEYRATRGDEKVGVAIASALHLDIGVNLLPSRRVAFYPYAGLSWRIVGLHYEAPAVMNEAYRNVSELVVNERSFQTGSGRIGYQAGLGFDLLLGENRKHSTNKVFFVKGGLDRPFGADRFRYGGINIANAPQLGTWEVYAGIKFGNKN